MVAKQYTDLKVYQIDKNFYELSEFNENEKIINFIINYHKTNFKSIHRVESSTEEYTLNGIKYNLYSFTEGEKSSVWTNYFPKSLSKENDFVTKSTSFVLFCIVEENIFCVIGGKGISVIKRYLNPTFGLDIYERIANPMTDTVQEMESRGISGKLTSEQVIYRTEQRLQDILSIGRLLKRVSITLSQEILDSIFDFLDFDDLENKSVEIGSAFSLKTKLTFQQLHILLEKLNEISKFENRTSISRFERIRDEPFINQTLIPTLLGKLRDEAVNLSNPQGRYSLPFDIDFLHPNKLNKFYECETYKLFFKGKQNGFYETSNRFNLFKEGLKGIYEQVSPSDPFSFNSILLGVRVKGYKNGELLTDAPFISHLTCELTLMKTSYFKIDNLWYIVKGDFINSISSTCIELISRDLVSPNPLELEWNRTTQNEGDYNLSYENLKNYFVFDKVIFQNIELCDILYVSNNTLYVIHVKEGFDAKIRDLTNQISISSRRLWNDLKSDKSYLKGIYDRYNDMKRNHKNISWIDFEMLFTTKEIRYVLAFTSSFKGKSFFENYEIHKSNIAKFSIINIISEQSESYPVNFAEIKYI
ncbi:DUF6119 family protein [Cellulophaga sp. BC115SP]|uniref:DUF6119 family protein n=1 Tax=Cellulophaga sp. BC115SP TaxID=2683263 RepID=UPI00141237A9|nr:DUF6119 family protein [Cellulophaga sp. BC115SP]NBB27824.1 hypothetical protein [Cellulophaga sp. BC115SP]